MPVLLMTFFSSEAQSWWAMFSLLVLCRSTWSRPLTQPWWKFSSRFYTASLSSFPTWRRSSPRSSVGSKQVWKLEGRQAPQAAAQILSITHGWGIYIFVRNQYPLISQCWIEGNVIQKVKSLKAVLKFIDTSLRVSRSEPIPHTSSTLLSYSIFPQASPDV